MSWNLVLIIISVFGIGDFGRAIPNICKPNFRGKTYGKIITFVFKLQ